MLIRNEQLTGIYICRIMSSSIMLPMGRLCDTRSIKDRLKPELHRKER